MRYSGATRGFTLVEVLISLLLFALIIVAFLSMLSHFSEVVKTQSGIAEANESARFTLTSLIRQLRRAGAGGLPVVFPSAAGTLQPLAVDMVDNCPDGVFSSSISRSDWGLDANRLPLVGTDVLRIRGVLLDPLLDVSASSFQSSMIRVPPISPWSKEAQKLHSMPSAAGRGLVVFFREAMEIRPSFGGVRRYGIYRILEIQTPPALISGALQINYDDAASQSWNSLNPMGKNTLKPSLSYAVGFLDDIVFYVSRNNFGTPSLYRLRVLRGKGSVVAEELVPEIVNLQVALGCDLNMSHSIEDSEWFFSRTRPEAPTPDQLATLSEIRISVISRVERPDLKWTDRGRLPENAPLQETDLEHYRHRILTERVALRSQPPMDPSREVKDAS